jgi:hypothetical protein
MADEQPVNQDWWQAWGRGATTSSLYSAPTDAEIKKLTEAFLDSPRSGERWGTWDDRLAAFLTEAGSPLDGPALEAVAKRVWIEYRRLRHVARIITGPHKRLPDPSP